jgi:hypothetical protein
MKKNKEELFRVLITKPNEPNVLYWKDVTREEYIKINGKAPEEEPGFCLNVTKESKMILLGNIKLEEDDKIH